MSWGAIQVTPELKKQLALMAARPLPVVYDGVCNRCGRNLPVGYLRVVVRWRSVRRGSVTVAVPDEMYCRECGSGLRGDGNHSVRRHKRAVHAPEAPQVSLREVAEKVFPLLSVSRGASSRKLARLVHIEDVASVKAVLRKLASVGKVVFKEKRWWRK